MTRNNIEKDNIEKLEDVFTSKLEGNEPEQYVWVKMNINSKALNDVPELVELKYTADNGK